ncbi:MAG: LarC family nickel insertion protein, partial [candidate division Zixibacteria bacterium]
MKLAYFDCFSGAAGDMIIGALLDAGLPFDDLKTEIEKLGLSGYRLSFEKVTRNHISATKFNVEITERQQPRNHDEIIKIITDSKLDADVGLKSIAIFDRLAKAEAKVHGQPIEKVHFHEVGAVDAIIDICGAVAALKLMGIEKIYSSMLPLGTGTVE